MRVRLRSTQITTASTIMMSVETGMGPTPVAPMSWNAQGTFPADPSKFVLRMPCRMSPTPSVAMKPLTLSTVTMSPFTRPTPAHTSSVTITATGMFAALSFIIVAASRLDRLIT